MSAPKLFSMLVLCTGTMLSFAQQSSPETPENLPKLQVDQNGWLKVTPDQHLTNGQFIEVFTQHAELGKEVGFELQKHFDDNIGMTHDRYTQTYSGVQVFDAELTVHSQNGLARSANGKWVAGLSLDVQPAVSSITAVATAMQRANAHVYMWEDKNAETLLKRLRNDPDATYYPKAELVIIDPTFSGIPSAYKLAWQIDIFSVEPLSRQWYFVDASSGEVLMTLDQIHTDNAFGTAATMYNDTVSIVTDSLAPDSFRLREVRDGVRIETYDMNKGIFYGDAVDFTDDDNFWDNFNSQHDEAATDGHWGGEVTHDYYLQYHGRNSFDNLGSPMLSFLHFRDKYQNAFWNGEFMTYGDGAGNSKPFVALDVCGHEFTHGVTQFSAGLIYKNESGALNESFSDIFGYMVEWMGDSSSVNWDVGEDIGALRDMAEPHRFANPDTYKGNYWYTASDDNGGVHYNSGVQNFWFYLLTDGDSGVNDNGDAYTVNGIGRHKAAAIAYRNLTVYLTKSSTYADARQGSIWAAEDLFGTCSDEMKQTAMAWYAVGVGDSLSELDAGVLKLETEHPSCGLTANENLSIYIKNTGCQDVASGDTITTSYKVNSGTVHTDTIVLTTPLPAGDTIIHTFSQSANLVTAGTYAVKCWVTMANDQNISNDTINVNVLKIAYQNTDLGVTEIISPSSSCLLGNSEDVVVTLQYLGCDTLPSGSSIPLAYRSNGGTAIRDTLVLGTDLPSKGKVSHTFSTKLSLTGSRTFLLDAWTEYPGDNNAVNDSVTDVLVIRPTYLTDARITFEDPIAAIDSFYSVNMPRTRGCISDTSAAAGNYAYQISGSVYNSIRFTYGYKKPTDLNSWTVNDDYRGELCLCIDASSWSTAHLTFDLRQTYNGIYSTEAGGPFPFTSNLRVMVNGSQIGDQYNPVTKTSDAFTFHHVDLSAYAGNKFEVCFETKNYEGRESEKYPALYVGDNAFIDNINVVETVNVGVNEPGDANEWPWGIYPNPSEGVFDVWVNSANADDVTVEVSNIIGQFIESRPMKIKPGMNQVRFAGDHWKPGWYLVTLRTGEGIQVQKILVY
ncbi:MAG: M4 family metallopeptidase [Flavobacteriales bacterium]|nr:M4 family metallopeptidase [Flavobacteriales bacterium]